MGKFSAYNLPLKSLGVGIHEFEYHLDKQFFVNMESADVRDADLCVKLAVAYNGDFYNLSFSISGQVILACDRCLDDLSYPVDASYNLVVKYGDDYNDDNDEVLEIPASDASLNVAYMIYDTVVLQIPMKHVHPQGKCNRQMSAILKKHRAETADDNADFGNELCDDDIDSIDACQSSGAPSDPRWNALRKLSGDDNITE